MALAFSYDYYLLFNGFSGRYGAVGADEYQWASAQERGLAIPHIADIVSDFHRIHFLSGLYSVRILMAAVGFYLESACLDMAGWILWLYFSHRQYSVISKTRCSADCDISGVGADLRRIAYR